jgi:hypothetical protein
VFDVGLRAGERSRSPQCTVGKRNVLAAADGFAASASMQPGHLASVGSAGLGVINVHGRHRKVEQVAVFHLATADRV